MTAVRFAGFALAHVVPLGVFALGAYGLGRAALSRLAPASPEKSLALFGVFGLGALSTVLFAAAMAGLLRGPLVVAALAAGSALAWFRGRAARDPAKRAVPTVPSFPVAVFLGLGAVLVGGLFAAALYPATEADSTMYHLPAMREFAAAHALPALADVRYPVFPQLHELLGAAALLVGDDVLAQLLNVLFALLAAGILWGWAARTNDRRVGALSAALWLGSPLVLSLARSAHVELAVSAFAIAAVAAADRARETRDPRWWAAAGAFAGWAAAGKYTGLYFVAALGIAALASSRGARLGSLAGFAAAALASSGPWYARSWLLSGNPVWPFLGGVFGYRFWSPGDVRSAIWTLKAEGGPHTWRAFFEFPWTVLRQLPYGPGRIAPVLCGLVPLGLIGALRRPRWRWLAALVLGYGAFWFWTTQQIRFLVPILPAAALVTAAGLLDLADALVPVRARKATAGLVAVIAVAAMGSRLVDEARVLKRAGPPPYDGPSREAYLERTLPSYFVYRALNAAHGSSYTIYAFHDEPMKYFCEGAHLGDWFGRGRYADVSLSSGAALFTSLRTLGASYLLVNEAVLRTPLPDDAFFRAHFEPAFERAWIRAYRLR